MPLYFAYGSNMDSDAMASRCPRSSALGPGRLMRHRFVLMGDGYASVERAPRGIVHGVVWDIALADMRALDEYEAIASGLYRKIQQPVFISPGHGPAMGARALVYVGNGASAKRRPAAGGARRAPRDYLAGVMEAARKWDLPEAYVRELAGWASGSIAGAVSGADSGAVPGASLGKGRASGLKAPLSRADDKLAGGKAAPVRALRDDEGNIMVRPRHESPLDRSKS